VMNAHDECDTDRIARFHIGAAMSILAAATLAPSANSPPVNARKEVEIFRQPATVAERAVSGRLGQVATVLPSLLGGQIADVKPLPDLIKLNRPGMQLSK